MALAAALMVAFLLGAGSDPRARADLVRADGTVLNTYFAVFNRPSSQSASNPFADPSQPILDPKTGLPLNFQPRSVQQLTDTPPTWVGATNDRICLSAESEQRPAARRLVCARPSQVIDSGLFLTGRAADVTDVTEVVGLVPDGVIDISLFDHAGRLIRQIPVHENSFRAVLAADLKSGSFRDRHGDLHRFDF